jgi:hypothetical protein
LFDYKVIDEYQLEITSYCNAACPQCPRNDLGVGINKRMPLCHLGRHVIDRAFAPELCERLRQVFNKEHSNETPIPEGDMHIVWNQLKDRFMSHCRSGSAECIITSMLSKPAAPSSWTVNPEEWLSSDDIDHVEQQ